MMTDSGLFVLDLPTGKGGLISFDVSKAAVLADFSNKNFAGISFPHNGPPEILTANTASVAADKVSISATQGAAHPL